MSKHHFIVAYDFDTAKWTWETDQEEERFKGTIQIGDNWVSSSHDGMINMLDGITSETLTSALNLLNAESLNNN